MKAVFTGSHTFVILERYSDKPCFQQTLRVKTGNKSVKKWLKDKKMVGRANTNQTQGNKAEREPVFSPIFLFFSLELSVFDHRTTSSKNACIKGYFGQNSFGNDVLRRRLFFMSRNMR